MFLKERSSADLIEVLSLGDLFNPCCTDLVVRSHHGEEMQEPEKRKKPDLVFPSGEELPRCWTDPDYHEDEIRRPK